MKQKLRWLCEITTKMVNHETFSGLALHQQMEMAEFPMNVYQYVPISIQYKQSFFCNRNTLITIPTVYTCVLHIIHSLRTLNSFTHSHLVHSHYHPLNSIYLLSFLEAICTFCVEDRPKMHVRFWILHTINHPTSHSFIHSHSHFSASIIQ